MPQNSKHSWSQQFLDIPFWRSSLRLAATIVTALTIALSTIVPLAMNGGHARYDASVAMSAITAIGAIWAVVFAAENIRAFTAAAEAEVKPLVSCTLHWYGNIGGDQKPPAVVIANVGRGAAVLVEVFLWGQDQDKRWNRLRLRPEKAVLAPSGDEIVIPTNELRTASIAGDEIAVQVSYREAGAKGESEEWFRFRSGADKNYSLPPIRLTDQARQQALDTALAEFAEGKSRSRNGVRVLGHHPEMREIILFTALNGMSTVSYSWWQSVEDIVRHVESRCDSLAGLYDYKQKQREAAEISALRENSPRTEA